MNQSSQPLLEHSVLGPFGDGTFLVVYACAHTRELTSVMETSSRKTAEREAIRLNAEQLAREQMIQMDRRLRGFRAAA
jgi:hypothetical protein